MGEFERYKKGMRGLEKIPGLGSMGEMYLSPRVVVNALKDAQLEVICPASGGQVVSSPTENKYHTYKAE